MSYYDRESFSVVCNASYPCSLVDCFEDYDARCPDGWTEEGTACVAPDAVAERVCAQTPAGFVTAAAEIKRAYAATCPNAHFPCMKSIAARRACTPMYTSCPTQFDTVGNFGCRLSSSGTSVDTSCPAELNLILMDTAQLQALGIRWVHWPACSFHIPDVTGLSLVRRRLVAR
eukprot:Blabericola_migrator_1__12713@NODE_813_length_6418_cov_269_331286_g573_i0_p5_GENE_NODE_813_length_6418_cov_269_331286_g573_i0NODE_813_length_6418_cov_269_331286_g573_i0_p5_ORF_typecomplete_len173_score1_54CPW_WPC/PF09717_10/14CPW_WPC/PF09717_10/3_9e08CPW_WPC/PF09717_10/6_NODE_813_length_6418_cov_269_331286_g573_i046435161